MTNTKSICPECQAVIDAQIEKRDGQVLVSKTCSHHGTFNDVYFSDASMYDRFEEYRARGSGVSNPNMSARHGCPG